MIKLFVFSILCCFLFLLNCGKEPTKPNLSSELKPKGSITGIVTDRKSHPLSGVIVSVNADSAIPGVSSGSGSFVVGSVMAGTYALQFLHRDYSSDTTYTITISTGQDLRMPDTVKLSYAYYILAGRVINNSGYGVPGVGVTVAGTALTTLTDENGEYIIPRVEEAQSLKIICAKTGFGFNTLANVTGIKNDTTDISDIPLSKPGCTITGLVTDSLERPVSGAIVMAVGGGLACTTKVDGRYTLYNFPSNSPDARIYIQNYNGTTGGITGLNAPDYTTLTGGDILLHAPAAMTHGMLLSGSDVVVSDTAAKVTLRIYPDADSITRIVSYEWFFGNASTPDTITTTPYLSISRTDFTGYYSGINNATYPVTVKARNSINEYSSVVTFNTMVKTLQIADSSITHKGTLNDDTTWYPKNNPHIVEGTYYVNAKLTIRPGVIVKFKTGAQLYLGYNSNSSPALIAEGTLTDSIVFTSADINPTPGSWDNIRMNDPTIDVLTSLRYCSIRYGLNGLYIDNAAPTVAHCRITNSKSAAVFCANGGFTRFDSNTVTNNKSVPLSTYDADVLGILSLSNQLSLNDSAFIRVGGNSSTVTLETSIRLNNFGLPYYIYSDLYVHGTSGSILTVAPGCTLAFASSKKLLTGYIYPGALEAVGTVDSPIVFTSIVKILGAWDGIYFDDKNSDEMTNLAYCVIEYGVHGLELSDAAASVRHCLVRKSSGTAVFLNSSSYFKIFDSNTVTDNRSYPLSLDAEYMRTIASSNIITGNDSNGICMGAGLSTNYIATSATWPNLKSPYLISTDIYIQGTSGPVISIVPGCTLSFANGKRIQTGYTSQGGLIALGTTDSPIVFTSFVKTSGAWDGIVFDGENLNDITSLSHCVIEYGVNGIALLDAQATVNNCVIRKSSSVAVTLNKAPHSRHLMAIQSQEIRVML